MDLSGDLINFKLSLEEVTNLSKNQLTPHPLLQFPMQHSVNHLPIKSQTVHKFTSHPFMKRHRASILMQQSHFNQKISEVFEERRYTLFDKPILKITSGLTSIRSNKNAAHKSWIKWNLKQIGLSNIKQESEYKSWVA